MFLRRKRTSNPDLQHAKRLRAESERLRDEARSLARQIRELHESNHFAAALRATLQRDEDT